MENCIYRFVDINKKLLYIGKAKNLEERLSNHNHLPIECYEKTAYIEYIEFPTMEDANIMERVLISMLKPPYNTEFKSNNITLHIMEVANLNWQKYKKANNDFPNIQNLNNGKYIIEVIDGKIQVIGEIASEPIESVFKNRYSENWEKYLEDIQSKKLERENKEKIKKLEDKKTREKNKSLENKKLLENSIDIIFEQQQASASLLQRYLKIGFNKASRIIDTLENLQIIDGYNGSKSRELLIHDVKQAKNILNNNLSNNDIINF